MVRVITGEAEYPLSESIVLAGVAELDGSELADSLLPPELLAKLPWAISLAVRVSPTVLATITDHPNQLYFHHYRQLNNLLDQTALGLAQYLEQLGGRALPIPASQVIDWQNQRGHLSHKKIAIAAGLGWLGRNNLVVTPEYGSQVRLVTVLTDRPVMIRQDRQQTDTGCGTCQICLASCPAQAIRESAADFDHQACFAQLKEFQRRGYVGQYICGLCVRVCGAKLQQGTEQ